MKKAILLFVFLALISPAQAARDTGPWTDVCPQPDVPYCKDVGKAAYNFVGGPRNIRLGTIIGVAWKLKGGVIGYSKAIPAAGIPASTRRSPRNAFYYIIDDGGGTPFLRQCREIEARL